METFFVIDELGLLPNLYHVEDGINFGRGLGVKFIVITRSVIQISDSYGEERAKSILSSLGTLFGFRLNDGDSKSVVSTRYGEYNALLYGKSPVPGQPPFVTTVNSEVVEPLLISLLHNGQAIICSSAQNPRFFQFKPFDH